MLPFRSLGELLPAVLERADSLAAFQLTLNDLASAAERKNAIITARCNGFIDDDAATMLIQVYALENA